jgi:hypothetical protein
VSKVCSGCGGFLKGYASIGDNYYCHGDEDASPTCYELAVLTPLDQRDCQPTTQQASSPLAP